MLDSNSLTGPLLPEPEIAPQDKSLGANLRAADLEDHALPPAKVEELLEPWTVAERQLQTGSYKVGVGGLAYATKGHLMPGCSRDAAAAAATTWPECSVQ